LCFVFCKDAGTYKANPIATQGTSSKTWERFVMVYYYHVRSHLSHNVFGSTPWHDDYSCILILFFVKYDMSLCCEFWEK
jgi:hypothetical protein